MGVRQAELAHIDGARLAEIRKRSRLSQAHLSKMAGVSNATISRLERGLQVPSESTVDALCRALAAYAGWNLDELVEVVYGRRKTWSYVSPIMDRMETLSRST
jgi:transcriptional regulator with XRE-family HTH domain